MTKSSQLVVILDKMRNVDVEHQEADDLLVEAIKLLSSNTIDKDKCNLIIEAYHNIDKWFS